MEYVKEQIVKKKMFIFDFIALSIDAMRSRLKAFFIFHKAVSFPEMCNTIIESKILFLSGQYFQSAQLLNSEDLHSSSN